MTILTLVILDVNIWWIIQSPVVYSRERNPKKDLSNETHPESLSFRVFLRDEIGNEIVMMILIMLLRFSQWQLKHRGKKPA